MASILNANYWKKAYLLEFKLHNVVTDVFTFSVPPESEEFVFPQRRNETKTFGGAVITDYGNDLVQINLSGSTINQELKLIYRSTFGYTRMTGEEEIFYLRNLLRDYGTRGKLQGKEVTLYSLNGGTSIIAKDNPKWWKITIGELAISRSKDKPFCYNYKFSAIGMPEVLPEKYNISKLANTVSDWKNKIDGFVDKMYSTLYSLEEYGAGLINDLNTIISTTNYAIESFNGAIEQYSDVINGIIRETGELPLDTVMLGDKVIYSAFRYYPTLVSEMWNSCLYVGECFKKIYNYCVKTIPDYLSTDFYKNVFSNTPNINTTRSINTVRSNRSVTNNTRTTTTNNPKDDIGKSSWQSIKELFDNTVSDEDISDVYATLAHEGLDAANQSFELTSKYLNNFEYAVIPGDTGEDDIVLITYGYKVVSVTDAETNWDQIAQNYYGDSSLSYIIATYNNLPIDQPLAVGQSILIPNLNFAENRVLDNEVYNNPDVKDNYGKDLMIKNNDLAIYNGDMGVIGGVDNLNQALLNRYSTLVGARIRLEVYGIQAAIGDALKASSSLIQASVHQTTMQDPRVESVEKIEFNGTGDQLVVSVFYVDKNGDKQNFGGIV